MLVPLKVSEETSKWRLISSAGTAGEGGFTSLRGPAASSERPLTHFLLASYRLLACILMQKLIVNRHPLSAMLYYRCTYCDNVATAIMDSYA